MSDVKIVLDSAGIQSLLKSDEVAGLIQEITEQVQRNAGEGYETTYQVGKKRYIGEVRAATYKARKDNSRNNTLLKALHK